MKKKYFFTFNEYQCRRIFNIDYCCRADVFSVFITSEVTCKRCPRTDRKQTDDMGGKKRKKKKQRAERFSFPQSIFVLSKGEMKGEQPVG